MLFFFLPPCFKSKCYHPGCKMILIYFIRVIFLKAVRIWSPIRKQSLFSIGCICCMSNECISHIYFKYVIELQHWQLSWSSKNGVHFKHMVMSITVIEMLWYYIFNSINLNIFLFVNLYIYVNIKCSWYLINKHSFKYFFNFVHCICINRTIKCHQDSAGEIPVYYQFGFVCNS